MEFASEKLEGNMILSGGNAVNSIPAYAKAELRLLGGRKKEIWAEGISGHAAFPQGAQNALGILAEKIYSDDKNLSVLSEKEEQFWNFWIKPVRTDFGRELNIDCADEFSRCAYRIRYGCKNGGRKGSP